MVNKYPRGMEQMGLRSFFKEIKLLWKMQYDIEIDYKWFEELANVAKKFYLERETKKMMLTPEPFVLHGQADPFFPRGKYLLVLNCQVGIWGLERCILD